MKRGAVIPAVQPFGAVDGADCAMYRGGVPGLTVVGGAVAATAGLVGSDGVDLNGCAAAATSRAAGIGGPRTGAIDRAGAALYRVAVPGLTVVGGAVAASAGLAGSDGVGLSGCAAAATSRAAGIGGPRTDAVDGAGDAVSHGARRGVTGVVIASPAITTSADSVRVGPSGPAGAAT
jgi:hypothetical protein